MNYYALSVNTIPVGVLGGSGYAGRELCRLILGHPDLSLAFATANEQRGATVRVGGSRVTFADPAAVDASSAALVFSALPHGASAEAVERARAAGARVVDLSSDLRPGAGTGAPVVAGVPYGLTELARDDVRGAQVVANPGCYATAVLLALLPLARRGLIAHHATIAVSAASGVTGAGNSPKRELLFGEVAEDFRPYATGNVHRHLHEMRAALAVADIAGAQPDLVFTPHLLPVARGIVATMTVPLAGPLADPLAPWREAYEGEPFIEIADEPPALRDVVYRNVARLHAVAAAGTRAPLLQVHVAIDNLLKGAAGQAVQNANVMLGLDESAGLPS
jgi:N-acetyl-gamma-glutamyl-phosphate reductase